MLLEYVQYCGVVATPDESPDLVERKLLFGEFSSHGQDYFVPRRAEIFPAARTTDVLNLDPVLSAEFS
jgi:hypothetical protein